jgi:WD40 repeat protein
MVNVILGQSSVIQENYDGENEIYFHANGLPGVFYACDAETGHVKFSEVVQNSEAVWAMTAGPDKNIYYTGTSDRKLYRYLPTEKRIEYLGSNPSDGWVWGLFSTPDGKLYGSTYSSESGGKVFEYDIATGKFRNFGTVKEGQDYAFGIFADEDFIYVGLGTNLQLYRIDRKTGDKSEIIIPENPHGYCTGGRGKIDGIVILKNRIFITINTNTMVVIDKDTHKLIHSFNLSCVISEPSPYNPDMVYYEFEGKLFRYNYVDNETTHIKLESKLPTAVRFHHMKWLRVNSGVKKGKSILAMINQYGQCALYDPGDNSLSVNTLEVTANPVRITTYTKGMDNRIYLGGYMRGMSIYNPFTNNIDLTISQFAQSEGIKAFNGKVYYGTYTKAIIYCYEPDQPGVFLVNPKEVYRVENYQDRPFALAASETKLFVGTIPDYGYLGGSLAIYCEPTDTWTQYNNVVNNQSISALAYKDGLLYGSTTIWGGLGVNPTESEAKIFIWDLKTNTKIDEFTIRDLGIDIKPQIIGELSFGPDGLLWGVVGGMIFAIDLAQKRIVKSRNIFPEDIGKGRWKGWTLLWGTDGMIYSTIGRKIVVIHPEALCHKIILDGVINELVLGIDGSIFYVPEGETKLYRIAVPHADATLSGLYINDVLVENFSPGTTQYQAKVNETDKITATPAQDGATVTIINKRKSDEPILVQVIAANGVSTLEYRIN